MNQAQNIALIGGGVASIAAIETLRAEGYEGRIQLVSDEAEMPYDRPPLSKGYLSGETSLASILLHDQAWYVSMSVELHLGRRVQAIDVPACLLRFESGDPIAYDRLLIATGARPRTLPENLCAADVPVHFIRSRCDADGLRQVVKQGARVVLIGGGVIGMEAAATLVQRGCQVTVLEAGDRIMARFFPAALSEMLAVVHASHGVDIRTGVVIESVTQRGAESLVQLVGGTLLVADVVVVGVGVQPNTELATEAGLALHLQGVQVDERGQTSANDVYAAGDVTTFQLPGGRWTRWENWTHARLQAAHAARHMIGKGLPYAELPWVWSDQYELNLQVLGSAESTDPVVIRGSLDSGRLSAFHLQDGKLVGATLINDGRHKSAIRKLVEKGAMVLPEQLADASVDLKKLAAAF